MSLPYSPSRAVYQGNGAATAFPFAFKVWNDDQLDVSITSPDGVSSPAQGWTATLGECGGSVTYLHDAKPLPSGWRLAIVRNMPFSQDIDLVSASRFDPQVIEDGLDQATAERQELNEKIARAVILPATSDQSPEEVVATIYASRDTALASANTAEAAATAAASCAATAEQNVQTATAAAVNTATTQAASAALSAAAAARSAEEAAAALPENLAQRITATEAGNSQQDERLDAVETDVAGLETGVNHATTKTAMCATASATAAKVAACDGFELSLNARVLVIFSYANTVAGALTLNVNGTGDIAIHNELGALSSSNRAGFAANVPFEFIYNGVHWTCHKFASEAASLPGGAPYCPIRAWANFDQYGNIRASKNISSIVDKGTGYYGVNMLVGAPDLDYGTLGMSGGVGSNGTIMGEGLANSYGGSVRSPTYFEVGTAGNTNSGVVDDPWNTVAAIW